MLSVAAPRGAASGSKKLFVRREQAARAAADCDACASRGEVGCSRIDKERWPSALPVGRRCKEADRRQMRHQRGNAPAAPSCGKTGCHVAARARRHLHARRGSAAIADWHGRSDRRAPYHLHALQLRALSCHRGDCRRRHGSPPPSGRPARRGRHGPMAPPASAARALHPSTTPAETDARSKAYTRRESVPAGQAPQTASRR